MVKLKGIITGARSEIAVIPKAMQSKEKLLIGGAHLIEAACDAWDEAPTNQNVKATIEGGVFVTEFDARAPHDILVWFKDELNSMNQFASRTSFLE
eukprot:14972193-Alexandrium_andersonii.AAC.1